ncbi:MAG: carboxylesterase family protein, partial [Chitinophagales bacterium]|nr:carboxylesterase family protein [Chitinophagales bacterium]
MKYFGALLPANDVPDGPRFYSVSHPVKRSLINRMLAFCILIVCSLQSFVNVQAQTGSERCSMKNIFTDGQIVAQQNIIYGNAVNNMGLNQDLLLDIYYPDPAYDTLEKIPLIVLVHGGGFKSGSKYGLEELCREFAKKGYVAASIGHRLGWNKGIGCTGDQIDFERAAYRSIQDLKASLRYLVHNAGEYKIDTSWIFTGGLSSGGVAAIHIAYATQEEIDIMTNFISSELGHSDSSGNDLTDTYTIKGILNDRSAVFNSGIIDPDQNVPIVSFHGTGDHVVPFDTGAVFECYTPVMFKNLCGSSAITDQLEAFGIHFELNYMPGGNHGSPYDDDYLAERGSNFFKGIMLDSIRNVRQIYALYAEAELTSSSVCPESYAATVELTGTGGTPPYQYSSDGIYFQNSKIFTLNEAGNYTFYIRDFLENISPSNVVEIVLPSTPVIDSVITTRTSCSYNADGSLEIFTSEAGTLAYSIDGIDFTADAILNNLHAGSHPIFILNQNNCISSYGPVTIQAPESIILLSDIISQNNCAGNAEAVIKINATGGTTPYLFSQNNIDFHTESIFDSLAAGNYTFYVSDANGCVASAYAGVADGIIPPAIILSPDTISICTGDTILLNANSIEEAQYTWFRTDIAIESNTNSLSVTDTGYYTMSLITLEGCTAFGNGVHVVLEPETAWYADEDNDGDGNTLVTIFACNQPTGYVSSNTDCNDQNGDINTVAGEICNTVDDDCDGSVDEGVLSIFYADTDGDLSGDLNYPVQSCMAPEGFVSDNTDCDDLNQLINPGTPEICNLLDDNCSGVIDEDVQTRFYADTDGDNFGDVSVFTSACSAPAGYVSDNTDCNDGNYLMNATVNEICNSLDDNCNGAVDESVASIFYADADGDNFGDVSVFTSACSAPAGYVSDNTDCNDGNYLM